MKAAIAPLCSILLLVTLQVSPGQTDPAVQAAIHKQADRIQLRQRLEEAREAELRRDLPTAAKKYDDAWRLVESIGPGVEAERYQTVTGLTAVRMQLARAAQKRGDLRDAETQVRDVLRVNPHDQEAQKFYEENQRQLAVWVTRVPSPTVQERVPAIQKERDTAAIHVQNARMYLDMGKLDEAEAELKSALEITPGESTAQYYYSLVTQERIRRAGAKRTITSGTRMAAVMDAWNDSVKRESLQVPNPAATDRNIHTGEGRQVIMNKLTQIRFDQVNYDGLPLSEVIRSLREDVLRRDPVKPRLNFVIKTVPEDTTPNTIPAAVGGPGGGFPGVIPPPVQQPAIDPVTGAIIPPTTAPPEIIDINSVLIRLSLSDVRLVDVLDGIVTVADQPIKYSIKDYAIIFSLKGEETPQLEVRNFRVDPNTFYMGLESVGGLDFSTLVPTTTGAGGAGGFGGGGGGGFGGGGGGGFGGQGGGQQQGGVMTIPRVIVSGGTVGGGGGFGGGGGGGVGGGAGGGGGGGGGLMFVTRTNGMAEVQTAVINFFLAVGVDLRPVTGKNVFFNDRHGTLTVRATSQDLDLIEAAIQTLNIAPPQVNVKAKFVEVTQNDNRALGFDWFLGNFLMGGGRVGAQGGTAPSFSAPPTAANPLGTFPGSQTFPVAPGSAPGTVGGLLDTTILPSPTDQLLTRGLRNNIGAPELLTFTGILTDPQFRVVIRALEQRDGADVLNEGQVTTLSGRQAQIQVVDLRFIVTSTAVNQQAGGGGAVAGGTAVTPGQPVQNVTPVTSPIPLGPTLDVIPYVSADGYTIQMNLIPTITEFIGYDDPGPFVIQAQSGNAIPLVAQLPLPHFRVRQVTTSVVVWDGQTVVLGGLIADNVTRFKDKVPVLGDIPFVGRLFRSESSVTQKKNLVIFVTPTIIDPAGNRLNNEEDLPYSVRNTIPAQPLP